MGKILTFSIGFLLCYSVSFSQSVNGTPLKDIDVDYVRIVGTSKLLSTKVTIQIEFGQVDKYWNLKDTKLLDESGKPLELNSMVDALNFMSKNGYEFLQAYALTIGNQNVYHYLMKRKK
ncbi:MAG: hypothetical protein AAFR61_00050 [Bacteroidota bacterium]